MLLTFIEYELKEHFRLKTGDARALSSYQKELYKAYAANKGRDIPAGDGLRAAPQEMPYLLRSLRRLISRIRVHKSPVEDVRAAKQFVKEALYNIEPLDAGTFIEYELKEHFRLKTGDARALSSHRREIVRGMRPERIVQHMI